MIADQGSIHNDDQAKNLILGEESIQGHVSQKIRQRFKLERTREIRSKRLKLDAVEFIVVDQFGNKYFLFRALLFDGEIYEVAQWFWEGARASDEVSTFGGNGVRGRLVGEFKRFREVNDALMDFAREQAFLAFGRSNLAIAKAKSLSASPQAIEPKDITASIDRLTKAIEAAGKAVQAEPSDAKKLLTEDPPAPNPAPVQQSVGEVIAFPGVKIDIPPSHGKLSPSCLPDAPRVDSNVSAPGDSGE